MPYLKDEYQKRVALLDCMIDEVGEDESHPLASFMEVVGILIEMSPQSGRSEVAQHFSAGIQFAIR
ncbi:MAG TPA: hypothetical protein VHE60_16340 [Pyrinomonadaceae bacterium]|nr:hypothetical protein [Pyrinomonadaceae bacterium]